jgi:hypothetical protein
MENKQTSEQALVIALKTQRDLFIWGSNWNKQANHVVARNVLHAELGRYSDDLPIYNLDQETRDRLLVHARQDAAEALYHASSLMDDVHQLKSTVRGLSFSILCICVTALVLSWWKWGLAPWEFWK